MTTKVVLVLIVIASLKQVLGVSNFICDNTDVCIPSGSGVTCTCTVEDEGGRSNTLWDGSVFTSQCFGSGDQVILLHRQFASRQRIQCGNRISAVPVGQELNNFTSNATITVSTSNNGSTLNCSEGGPPTVGTKVLYVGEIPPAPSNLNIPVESLTRERFALTWTAPVNVFGGVGSYQIIRTSDDQENSNISMLCGRIIAPNGEIAPTRTFFDWVIKGQTCNFSVSTVTGDNCEFISAPSEEVSITLQGPNPANVEQVSLNNPVYTDNQLSMIDISFIYGPENPVTITRDVTSITTNFSITYSYSSGGNCTMIVPLSCDPLLFCNYTLSLGTCSSQTSGLAVFSVVPLNIIGRGNSTNSNMIESMNPLFTVSDVSTTNSPNVSLQLTFPMMFTSATCYLGYGLGAGCGNLTLNKTVVQQSSGNIVSIDFTLSSRGTHCYQVRCAVMPDTLLSLTPVAQGIINYQTGGGGDGDGGGSGGVTQFPPWAMAIIIIIILAILGTVGGIVIMCAVKKPWKNDSNGTKSSDPSSDGHGQLVPNLDDKFYVDPGSIEHKQAPAGDEYAMVDVASKKKQSPASDEYAVVDKSSKKANPMDATANQALYQDPGSIEHEKAPTGDFYAMPQQKGKKGKNQVSSVDPLSADVAAMYSTVDTSKKKTQLTYAQLDVGSGGGGGKPVPQSTSYATVIT